MAAFIRTFQDGVTDSRLPATHKHVLLTLAVWANYSDGVIPAEHTRSLTGIARATGLNRRTVERCLDVLEDACWVIRHRPSLADSRRGVRTWYELSAGKPDLGA